MAIKKTKNYEMFKFREDNRQTINNNHVAKLKKSIEIRNMLSFKPIYVNGDFEVIDGQHRLLAAKALETDIYYEVKEDFNGEEMVLMNISMAWTTSDFFNYYSSNGFHEYIKLKNFIEKNNFSLRVGLDMHMGRYRNAYSNFKLGKFVFREDKIKECNLEVMHETIKYIESMFKSGEVHYLKTTRFWKGLTCLVMHPDFKSEHWFNNLKKLIDRVSIKATENGYRKLLFDIYNWKLQDRIAYRELSE